MSRHRVTRREFDSILAGLRLSMHDSAWIADGDGMIRAIAEEHGDALTNEEIDALCQKLNLDGQAMRYKPMNADDSTLETLDEALCEAQRALLPLLLKHRAEDVVEQFASHVRIHMNVELGYVQSGKASEFDGDPDGSPSVTELREEFLTMKDGRKLLAKQSAEKP